MMKRNPVKDIQKQDTNIESSDVSVPSAALVYQPPTPSRKALEESPGRLMKFLHVAANDPEVALALKTVGYGNEDGEDGWRLLKPNGAAPTPSEKPQPTEAVKALAILDGWIGNGFRRSQATLAHRFPEQNAFLFQDLRVVHGVAAIIAVQTFLSRCDELQSSPDRKSTRKADHAALEAIGKRGITSDERKRLGALVMLSKSMTVPAAPVAPSLDAKTARLVAIHSFVSEWSELARTVISNRTKLIAMGIGKRRARGNTSTAPSAPPPPVVITPVVVTPAIPAAPPVPQLPAAAQTTGTDSLHLRHSASSIMGSNGAGSSG